MPDREGGRTGEEIDGRVGQEIGGRYRIASQLGAGGMATAYLAHDNRVRRDVVVKIPHGELLDRPGFRERFQREVRSLTELQHPGVVPLYDCGEEPDGTPWCVVRYLSGGDLADRLQQAGGRMPAAEIARWLPRVAEAIDFVHESGVLHRDLTPVNILFDEADNAFVSDFGVAAILRAADETSADDPRLTADGAFVGAALYAPPEAVSRELTPAYDQYSLALVLYQALCGYLPYNQLENRALMVAKNSDPPAPLDERGVPIPPAAVHAVMRGLSLEPRDRFRSCRALAAAFGAQAEGLATQEMPAPALPRGPGARWLPGVVVAVLAVVAIAGWWRLPGDPETAGPGDLLAARTPEATPAGERVLSGRFQAGTTREELAAALALCRQHARACPASLYDDETLREVRVAPFTLDRAEVTNREFADFVAATGHVTSAEREGTSRDGPFEERGLDWRRPAGPRSSFEDLPGHPVVHVSASDAEAYCAHHGGRLPSEDEWELAARGGEERRVYPWGDAWREDAANWASGELARLRASGEFPEGPYGHVDLAGNVWEWTGTHSESGNERVLKGGSWMETNPADLRAAVRLLSAPDDRSSDIGFRCARDAEQ